jgi:hypothetical protein
MQQLKSRISKVDFMPGSFFDPEDGSGMFLRDNVDNGLYGSTSSGD